MAFIGYCEVADVKNMIPRPTGSLTDLKIESRIEAAENLINGYIASKYTVPFVPPEIPPLIKTICIDLSCYYVLVTNFTNVAANDNEWVDRFYTRHLNQEKETGTIYDILTNKIPLTDTGGVLVPTSSEMYSSNNKDYNPTFNAGDPINQRVDPNKLRDIAEARNG